MVNLKVDIKNNENKTINFIHNKRHINKEIFENANIWIAKQSLFSFTNVNSNFYLQTNYVTKDVSKCSSVMFNIT